MRPRVASSRATDEALWGASGGCWMAVSLAGVSGQAPPPSEKLAALSTDRVAVVKAGGRFYVTLTGADDVLMCYRVRNEGKLKRMLRIPLELKGERGVNLDG
jgi:hypothetical protein